ncbi:hypothetical protein N7509_009968 [Penicillium cosmopolitanum]|uniref:Quinate transporter n=1 Tax=Penicillium cosmopolitanum TaxID=1131564 RepID=A0A9X0B454_9EURO|nr:uncharacterized protein N7509_009968 [Penicillium cosmopolitanum]KAJ5387427.1 hypothetical protein N7509_009968 [Penicillium cosmopolitanum]
MGFAFNAGDKITPREVFNSKLFLVILVASCGSIIFGYDLAFIGGGFDLDGQDSSAIQAHMVNSFQGGAFFGVMVAYVVNERFGRRFALLWGSIIFNIGVILCMASLGNIPLFYVGRIISGLGVGATTFAVPQYLSECAPACARGGIFEIGTQVGTITGFWINYGVQQTIDPIGDKQWFIPIAFQFIPSGLMAVGLFMLSESPRWLFSKHRNAEAVKALTWLRQLPAEHPYVANELEDYRKQLEHEADLAPDESFRAIVKETFSPRILPRVIHGCLLMIFQNSTGINAMNNFSVSFFATLGFHGTSVKLLSTGIYGIVKGVAATITFLFLVDRFGRRALLFAGSVMCAFSMYYVAAFSAITDSFHSSQEPGSASYSAVAFIYIFGAGYSVGWNIPWIVASEIFPTRIRSFCLVLTTCSHWLGEFYTSYAVTYMFASITYGTFLFFGSMTVLGGVYVYLFLPETKGIPLEKMDDLFGEKGFAIQKMRRFKESQRQLAVIEGREEALKEVDLSVKENSMY